MRLLLTLFLACSLAFPLKGHNPDSLNAEKYYKLYLEQWEKEEDAAALESLNHAIDLFRKAEALNRWLYMQATKGRFMAEINNQPFEAYQYMNECVSSKMLWRKPETLAEKTEYCFFFLEQAYVAKQYAEDFVGVKTALEKAYEIFHKSLNGKEDEIAAFLYFQLGNAYIRLGEFASAKRMFEEGLAYSYAHSAPKVAKYSDHAGLYIVLKNYPEAKRILLEGEKRKGLPVEDVLFNKLGLVECLAKLNDLEAAIKVNKELEVLLTNLSRSKSAPAKLPEFTFSLQENYGIIYAQKGDKNLAMFWYKEALKTARDYRKSSNRQCAFFEISIANLLLESQKPQEALVAFDHALKTIVPQFKNSSNDYPDPKFLKAENVILNAILGKARAFSALGQLEKALSGYELIPNIEAKLRATHTYESSSLRALEESRRRFQEAVDIAWLLFEQSNGNPQYTARAFRLTEQARGMLLLQSLIQSRQNLPDDIREKDYSLRARIAWLEHEIADLKEKDEKGNAKQIKDYEDQRFALKLERQNLLAEFPAYNDPDSVSLQVLSAEDVHTLLRLRQGLVDFFLTNKDAYIFSFDALGGMRWRKATLPAQFREQTGAFTAYLWEHKTPGREQFLGQAWLLDSLLLAPECKRWGWAVNSLILVPDDLLMFIPFEVLLRRPADMSQKWSDQPWLLNDYNLGYAYSATLLKVQKGISREHEHASVKPAQPFGGFAPSYTQADLYRLQSTRPMVDSVRRLLGGEAWLNAEASEARFKESIARYRIFLLAMHGFSDNEHPERSRLLFGDPGPDSLINNNVLYASELQIMRLQADLVVLSACHSGDGKNEQGEGVYSLARAFAAAGVPTTVMSLWLLHEDTAPPLVEAFFQYMKEGKPTDEALRLAKIQFLKNKENFDFSHPFFWAGLTASGDMQALYPAPLPIGWILLAATLLFAGFWWWRRKKLNVTRLKPQQSAL